MSQCSAVTGLGLAKAALCGQPKRMMARLSPKYFFVMLLAVVLTAGFSLSAAQASVMSAKMAMTADDGMAMSSDAGMGKMAADASKSGDCKACVKDAGGSDNPMHCPPACIAPVLAVLPQAVAMMAVSPMQQPSPLAAPFLRGRSSLPDPYPPRPSNLS